VALSFLAFVFLVVVVFVTWVEVCAGAYPETSAAASNAVHNLADLMNPLPDTAKVARRKMPPSDTTGASLLYLSVAVIFPSACKHGGNDM
jgi:divalent metal cation (Fe/Co/Zn/Cd) transporter